MTTNVRGPSGGVPYSFEVYPPRNPASEAALYTTIRHLASVEPQFISVTYGAGGSSHASSLDVLRHITSCTTVDALAHLTCVGSTWAETQRLVHEFLDAEITGFLALRGDLPRGHREGDEFLGDVSSAAELVQLIHRVHAERMESSHQAVTEGPRRIGAKPRSDAVHIAVAAFPNGHPNSRSKMEDIDTLLNKQAAGANVAITQLFFYANDYLQFVDDARAAGVTMPIVPGIMPITSPSRLRRVNELTGEKIPSTEEGRATIGIEYAVELVSAVIAGNAPGVHLYAFNQHETVLSVLARCNLIPSMSYEHPPKK
jgi:methylenetetrahydrofolate reductase (NADPH)